MQSYPFTSQVTYDDEGLPLYDRAVDSEFLRKMFRQYFSDGVFYDQSDRLQVLADSGMQVAVEPGSCHIQGAMGIEPNRRTLVVQAAEELDRIDTVVARLDLSLAVRSIDLYVIKGTAAESPQPPALTRDSTIWELGLANLFVAKNVGTISQQRITDTRLDPERCGQVGAAAQPPFDTAAFFAQLQAAIQDHQSAAQAQITQLAEAIQAVEGDSAWMMKELYDPQNKQQDVFGYVDEVSKSLGSITLTLPASGWQGSAAPYTQTVAVEGMTESWRPSAQRPGASYSEEEYGEMGLEEKRAITEALGYLSEVRSSEGQLVFACYDEKPAVDLKIQLEGVM